MRWKIGNTRECRVWDKSEVVGGLVYRSCLTSWLCFEHHQLNIFNSFPSLHSPSSFISSFIQYRWTMKIDILKNITFLLTEQFQFFFRKINFSSCLRFKVDPWYQLFPLYNEQQLIFDSFSSCMFSIPLQEGSNWPN